MLRSIFASNICANRKKFKHFGWNAESLVDLLQSVTDPSDQSRADTLDFTSLSQAAIDLDILHVLSLLESQNESILILKPRETDDLVCWINKACCIINLIISMEN